MSNNQRNIQRMLVAGFTGVCILGYGFCPMAQAQETPFAATVGTGDSREDGSPWGMGSSAEWSGEYPKFDPLLNQAGTRWLRNFDEWGWIQKKQGDWNWSGIDAKVADARTNHLRLIGFFGYAAPWATVRGDTRTVPLKDMQFWRDYTGALVTRYNKEIKYWEVWNEFNGSFSSSKNKPKDYADLVVAAYDTAKKIDPKCMIGLSVANFDVGFLDATIKAGAANHFDFICVHPYENLGAALDGGEVGYLSMASSLRQMLVSNKLRADMPLWITEMGASAPANPSPGKDANQAEAIVKGHILAFAQGFEKLFWFEARGMSYGQGSDLGIIRKDWTLRPSYDAYKVMTGLMGPTPRYIGWLDTGKGGYGFIFQGKNGNVLCAWAPPGKELKTAFRGAVIVIDMTGKETPLAAGEELTLTKKPVFIINIPPDLARLAAANLGKPYPWGGDYSHAQAVICKLQATNVDDGIKQMYPKTTTVVNDLVESWRRSDFHQGGEGHYVYFRTDPLFAPFGTKNLEITAVVRRTAPDKPAGMNVTYESTKGYKGQKEWFTIPADDKWHEAVWKITDANFVGQWGWNFRLDASGSPNEYFIKEVRVRKSAAQ